jgi:hypothetical protein
MEKEIKLDIDIDLSIIDEYYLLNNKLYDYYQKILNEIFNIRLKNTI